MESFHSSGIGTDLLRLGYRGPQSHRIATASISWKTAEVGNPNKLKRIVQEYVDAGVDELVISPMRLDSAWHERNEYDRLMQEVVPEFR